MALKTCFLPGDILVPQHVDLQRWAVIACDQFTSRPDYWAKVERDVGDAPSTLRLMLPEAYLCRPDLACRAEGIPQAMADYLAADLFQTVTDSYIYVERTLSGGGLRRGLLGLVDLEAYDYRPGAVSPVRATEGLVQDRLPPRTALRRRAVLETPHMVLFCDDPAFTVMDCARAHAEETLYDFPLMEGGGRVRGRRISGAGSRAVRAALAALGDPALLRAKYGESRPPVLFAVGDGNHSLAAAKQCWEDIRDTLDPAQRETHPARFALGELVDLHEPAIAFEAIHRLLCGTDTRLFRSEAAAFFARYGGRGHTLRCLTADGSLTLTVDGTIGQYIDACEAFAEEYAARHGGCIDYIHGASELETLARRPGCAGIVLPELSKAELFPSIIRSGALPKKSFSIGPALDKRYYLECRRITE